MYVYIKGFLMLESLPTLTVVLAGNGELEKRGKLDASLEGGSPLLKRQFQSNIIKAQKCNNCQLITENNKFHIRVSLSQMPTSGANCDHAANPFLLNREITVEQSA